MIATHRARVAREPTYDRPPPQDGDDAPVMDQIERLRQSERLRAARLGIDEPEYFST